MSNRLITDNFGKVKLEWIQLRTILLRKFQRLSDQARPTFSDDDDEVFAAPEHRPRARVNSTDTSYGKPFLVLGVLIFCVFSFIIINF